MTMSLLLALAFAAQLHDASATPVPPPDCTMRVATRTTIEDIHGHWAAWRNRCVAVRGIWAGEALYRGETAARDRRIAADPAARPDRIGIVAAPALERRSWRPGDYLAGGLLVDCAEFGAARRGLDGFCLDRNGPVLLVADMYRRSWPTIRADR
jgi:hypothetical protein